VDEVEIFLQAQVQAWNWARFRGIGFQKTLAKWYLHPIDYLRKVK